MITILHVDDDADVLEISKISLEMQENIKVTSCISGKEALFAVENFSPDLFLLDYMMPELTGPELLKKLRQVPSLQNIAVVFMTARVHEEGFEELWELGALDVISKPFDPMTLGARVQEAFSRWRTDDNTVRALRTR